MVEFTFTNTVSKMIKYFPVVVIMIITLACKSSSNKQAIISLENERLTSIDETLRVKIENKERDRFYFIDNVDKVSHCKDKNAISSIITSIAGDTIIEYSGISDDLRVFDKVKNWDSLQIEMKKEESLKNSKRKTIKTVLNKNESIKINIKFNSESEGKGIGFCGYEFNNKEKYFIQLVYSSDSTFVKQNISKKLLDSLRKNDIKIFHGTIYSNKVPLKFD